MIMNKKKFQLKNNYNHEFKIIIDGKAGSGKTTVAKILSELLSITTIDTGYILKATSLKLYTKKINMKNLDTNYCKNIIKNLNLSDLILNNLDSKKLLPITSLLAQNKIVRSAFNKKIKEFSRLFNSFIFTGRDTGSQVFKNDINTFNFFFDASNKICAERKMNKSNIKKDYNATILRNKNDHQVFKLNNKTIILKNNYDNPLKIVPKILKKIF